MSGRPRPPSAPALAHGATLQAVAEHLDDGGWFVVPGYAYDGSDAYLHGPGGEQLHVTFGDGSHRRTDWGRIVFATALPDHLRSHQLHGDPGPSVTVAGDRAPRAIAADLRRRLLPRHRAYLATVTRHATRDAEEQARTARLRAEILQILHGHDGRWLDHSQRVRFGRAGDPVEGDARVQAYASTVRFEIAVAQDHAPALARVLAALCATANHDRAPACAADRCECRQLLPCPVEEEP